MTERLHFDFSLSCIGEGNGNPLQCSCLENPRDRGAWRAAVYGVAQSQTRLKRLSSSSNTYSRVIRPLLWRRKWQPTPVFLPGESQGRGSLVAAVCGVAQSRTRLKRLSSSGSSTDWLGIMPSSFNHAVADDRISLFLMAE